MSTIYLGKRAIVARTRRPIGDVATFADVLRIDLRRTSTKPAETSTVTKADIMTAIAAAYNGKEATPETVAARRALKIDDDSHTVLGIDGGGVRGMIPLIVLDRFERTYDVRCYEFFDVLMGTSTGTIICALLASGMSAGEVLEFYKEHIHDVFTLSRGGSVQEPYADEYVRDFRVSGRGSGAARVAITAVANRLFAERLDVFSSDRKWRLLGGSPVYDKTYLRETLQQIFESRGCTTLGALSRKHGCLLVFTTVDSVGGGTVFMSATGSTAFPGSFEHVQTSLAVEASVSAPLYFDHLHGLVDGGTLGFNFPTLGGLLHLEDVSRKRIDEQLVSATLPEQTIPLREYLTTKPERPALDGLILQAFDLNRTAIFALGCGVTSVKPLAQYPVKITQTNLYYGHDDPYGELTRLKFIIDNAPTGLGDVLLSPFEDVSTGQRALGFVQNIEESLEVGARLGVTATVNAIMFVKDGLAKEAGLIQERVFRSALYGGDYRRFQLSLDRQMMIDGIWRFSERYDKRDDLAKSTPDYQMPFSISVNGSLVRKGIYDLLSVWDELDREGLGDIALDLQPLGSLALRWVVCIGHRFADAIEEFGQKAAAGPFPFMGCDLADDRGNDAFVSEACQLAPLPGRLVEILDALAV